jgi:outer membrane protein
MRAPECLLCQSAGRGARLLRTPPFQWIFRVVFFMLVSISLSGATMVQASEKLITLAEALNSTLEHHPLLETQKWEVEAARGAKRQASGQFDILFHNQFGQLNQDLPLSQADRSQLPNGLQVAEALNASTGYNFNVSRLLRNGVSFNSYMDVNRKSDNLINVLGNSNSQMGVTLVVPLLRNRGLNVAAATESAAGAEVAARQLDFQQTREQLLVSTATSYWKLVAAKQKLAVAIGSEERGRLLLENVRALIAADHLPRNEIYEVTANLADRTANRIAAEQEANNARVQLGLDMGLASDALQTIGDPAEGFPSIDRAISELSDDSFSYYEQLASSRRADIEALQRREGAAKTLFRAAQNAVQPQVNLQFATGYSQVRDAGNVGGFLGSLFSSLHRPDFQTGIVYEFSHNNDFAKGQLLQAQAKLREATLQKSELERQVAAAVRISWQNVRTSIMRLKSSNEAVEAFQQTLTGEHEKFGLGQSSLTELLTLEDRLTVALSSQVDAQQSYVLALAGLRLATGTLFPLYGAVDHIDGKTFQTIPAPGGQAQD